MSPAENEKRSAATYVYFLHCDGVYRNALKQELKDIQGKIAESKGTSAYYRRIATLRKNAPTNMVRTGTRGL